MNCYGERRVGVDTRVRGCLKWERGGHAGKGVYESIIHGKPF